MGETHTIVFTMDEASAVRLALQDRITELRKLGMKEQAQLALGAYMKIDGYHGGLLPEDREFLGLIQ